MKYAIFLAGSAGAGKSTMAAILEQHYLIIKRIVHIINLDPAVQYLPYEPAADIRDLITSQDVEEYMNLGPNASLVYAVEHFMDEEQSELREFFDYEEDFLLIDCPGEIELFVEFDCFKELGRKLETMGYVTVCCYLTESQKVELKIDYLSNILVSSAVRSCLNMAFLEVYTKCDLCPVEAPAFDFSGDFDMKIENVADQSEVIEYSYNDEDSITTLEEMIDYVIHFGEE